MLLTSRYTWFIGVFIVSCLILAVSYSEFFLEKGHTVHKVALGVYAACLAGMLVLVLFPAYMLRPFGFTFDRVNLIPLRSIRSLFTNPKEVLRNLLLFMPFGFFSVLHDRAKAGRRLLNVLWKTALTSVCMEALQACIGRVPDIDDVIINTMGGMIGGLACVIWYKTKLDRTQLGEKIMPELPKKWRGRLAIPQISFIVLLCYGVALISANAVLTRDKSSSYTAVIGGEAVELSLEATSALLMDAETDEVIFALNAQEAIYPASTLKLLTCLTALDIAGPEDEIRVGSELLMIDMDCSRAGIKMGTTYTLRELLGAALLPSGADACYAIGVYCGCRLLNDEDASKTDAIAAFVEAENAKLVQIGALDTTVKNIEGLDEEGQLTTAEDLTKIAKAVLENRELAQIVGMENMTIGPEEDRITMVNTNQILDSQSDYYDPDFIGIKTGSTSKAGNCLMGAFERNGKKYITIVMNSGYEGKFADTIKLSKLISA